MSNHFFPREEKHTLLELENVPCNFCGRSFTADRPTVFDDAISRHHTRVQRLRLIIDNRVRLDEEALADAVDGDVIEKLVEAFEHKNPAWGKNMSMFGFPRGEPQKLVTWTRDAGVLSFPRGGLSRIRTLLEKAGIDVRMRDARAKGCIDGRKIPKHKLPNDGELWSHQVEALDALLSRENCLLRAGTGCLAGEALVKVNRAGRTFTLSIETLVARFNGYGEQRSSVGGKQLSRKWDPNIPTTIRARSEDGHVRLIPLVDAWASGAKRVFKVKTKSRHELRATIEHRFLTSSGWKQLGELCVGDKIWVEDPVRKSRQKKAKKTRDVMVKGMRYHPHATQGSIERGDSDRRVAKHRLIAEARLNSLSYPEFVRAIRHGSSTVRAKLSFLDPSKWHIHHIDEDHDNNEPDNLLVMSKMEHFTHHGRESGWKNVVPRTMLSSIESIAFDGVEQTYDLECGEPHNYLASGVVVHNSGKTTVLLAAASLVGVPALVMVPTSRLFDQWVRRAGSELGLRGDHLGIIKGSRCRLRPLTIAMRHTLGAQGVSQEMKDYFGCVMVDEVQVAPANSCYRVIDEFPARYRFGVSADEARKDRKECLTYDLFGEVAYEIKRDELIEKGIVLDVEMRVVPTKFDAPWYRGDDGDFENDAVAKDPNFGRLLEEMARDADRETLVDSIVKHEVLAANEQVVVLSRRREHAAMMDSRFASFGISCGLVMGGEDFRKVSETTIDGLASGELKVGVGTLEAIGTGIDMPAVGVGIMSVPISKNAQLLGQVWGRFCRKPKGKTRARLYYLLDTLVFGLSPLRAMSRAYRKVFVLDRGHWVPAKDYLRGARAQGTKRGIMTKRSTS